MNESAKSLNALKEAGINILHYLDHLDQATFSMPELREQLRCALADCGVEPERISPNFSRSQRMTGEATQRLVTGIARRW